MTGRKMEERHIRDLEANSIRKLEEYYIINTPVGK